MSDKFALLIRSGNPLIAIETTDETRATNLVQEQARQLGRPLFEWTITEGLRPLNHDGLGEPIAPAGKAVPALQHIAKIEIGRAHV